MNNFCSANPELMSLGAMPTFDVGMRIAKEILNMPTASVGMAPLTARLTERWPPGPAICRFF
jgi:hypothetical protein